MFNNILYHKLLIISFYKNNNINLNDLCKIYRISKESLYKWIKRYDELQDLKKNNVKNELVKLTIINYFKSNKSINYKDLALKNKKCIKKNNSYN
tara:strand:- start:471 stop:755 length:285 start_codon:yes stop_codon:yes gene_type:complete